MGYLKQKNHSRSIVLKWVVLSRRHFSAGEVHRSKNVVTMLSGDRISSTHSNPFRQQEKGLDSYLSNPFCLPAHGTIAGEIGNYRRLVIESG